MLSCRVVRMIDLRLSVGLHPTPGVADPGFFLRVAHGFSQADLFLVIPSIEEEVSARRVPHGGSGDRLSVPACPSGLESETGEVCLPGVFRSAGPFF